VGVTSPNSSQLQYPSLANGSEAGVISALVKESRGSRRTSPRTRSPDDRKAPECGAGASDEAATDRGTAQAYQPLAESRRLVNNDP